MPISPDDPLHRTNIHIYERDVLVLKNHYGTGWSVIIRQLVRDHCNAITNRPRGRTTVGDLIGDDD